MIRKHKKYTRPKHAFDAERIKSEDVIVKKYGLKNKKELWKAKSKLDLIRRQAKKLVNSSEEEEQTKYIEKLNKLGYKINNPVDVLALTEEDILNRRVQTIVFKKGIATTPKSARQMIVHKNILIDGKVVNRPSYNVKTNEEDKITQKKKEKKVKKVEEETKE